MASLEGNVPEGTFEEERNVAEEIEEGVQVILKEHVNVFQTSPVSRMQDHRQVQG